jgi:pilus assembly protein CpaE
MPPHISLVIIDSDRNSRETIAAFLKPFADTIRIDGSVADFGEGLRIIQKATPNVIIIEVNDVLKGVEEITFILSRFPRTSIIVSSTGKESDGILRLMRAGAVEYLLRPVVEDELMQALQKVGRFYFAKPHEEKKRGKIISVYYPTGGSWYNYGCGKSCRGPGNQ